MTERERPTSETVRASLIVNGFANNAIKLNIISTLMREEDGFNLAMCKAAGILYKIVSDRHQPISEGKTLQEAWIPLQQRFQHINPIVTSRLIYDATSKKLSDFKDVREYISSYQSAFDKVVGPLSETSYYTRHSTEMYFQATMLMNIGSGYSALVSVIKKDWKDETTNLTETVLQIIRHFQFMEGNRNKNDKTVLQASAPLALHQALKGSCINPECVEKDLTTHNTDLCWIKNPELRAKYAPGRMRTRESSRNLKTAAVESRLKTEPTPDRKS